MVDASRRVMFCVLFTCVFQGCHVQDVRLFFSTTFFCNLNYRSKSFSMRKLVRHMFLVRIHLRGCMCFSTFLRPKINTHETHAKHTGT